jgi:hypothetical protein
VVLNHQSPAPVVVHLRLDNSAYSNIPTTATFRPDCGCVEIADYQDPDTCCDFSFEPTEYEDELREAFDGIAFVCSTCEMWTEWDDCGTVDDSGKRNPSADDAMCVSCVNDAGYATSRKACNVRHDATGGVS